MVVSTDREMRQGGSRSRPPHVALLVETSLTYGREILRGVARYIREKGPWTVFFDHRSLEDPAPPWLRNWDGDGIITSLLPRFGDLIIESGIPTVDLDDQMPQSGLPTVRSDHEAIGAMAAGHLLERGFAHFAFLGYPQFEWSRRRWAGFHGWVRTAGHSCERFNRTQPVSWGHGLAAWEDEIEQIAQWLDGLPKPLGVMACNDYRGGHLLDACRRANLAVPDEVAVVGVDNDVLACELSSPPLTSIVPDCEGIGYRAAEMLDHLIQGDPLPRKRRLVRPFGIVARQSTDSMAIHDPVIAEAMRFIRENACAGIRVEDVAEHTAVSRSVLQRRFRAVLGQTVHTVIVGVRLQHVKQLLSETNLSLMSIAERSGFTHADYMSTAFRKATGSSPGVFRRAHGKSRSGRSAQRQDGA